MSGQSVGGAMREYKVFVRDGQAFHVHVLATQ